jgi:hypothetical protein
VADLQISDIMGQLQEMVHTVDMVAGKIIKYGGKCDSPATLWSTHRLIWPLDVSYS